jgi:hypothetical protein
MKGIEKEEQTNRLRSEQEAKKRQAELAVRPAD